MKPISLNKEMFLNRIANIESNPDKWEFLGDKPALIDFFAPWCGPCKMLMPILDELAEEYAGRIDIYKVNVDEEEYLARAFAIRSVPTLIFAMPNGEPQRAGGLMSKQQLKAVFDELLRAKS